mmetsp:Transcript_14868/g.21630  ORF Transcript_14868/g.21630 Transcript_14868/m.21630 type:complete len:294 (-) Transcript_14868:153-1034(-)
MWSSPSMSELDTQVSFTLLTHRMVFLCRVVMTSLSLFFSNIILACFTLLAASETFCSSGTSILLPPSQFELVFENLIGVRSNPPHIKVWLSTKSILIKGLLSQTFSMSCLKSVKTTFELCTATASQLASGDQAKAFTQAPASILYRTSPKVFTPANRPCWAELESTSSKNAVITMQVESVLPAATTSPEGSNLTHVIEDSFSLAFLVFQAFKLFWKYPTPIVLDPEPTTNLSPFLLQAASSTPLFWKKLTSSGFQVSDFSQTTTFRSCEQEIMRLVAWFQSTALTSWWCSSST